MWDILAVTLFFMGQFALFTYLRPFLGTVTQAGVSTLSLVLLGMGTAGLLGTYLIGFLVAKRLSAVSAALLGGAAILAIRASRNARVGDAEVRMASLKSNAWRKE